MVVINWLNVERLRCFQMNMMQIYDISWIIFIWITSVIRFIKIKIKIIQTLMDIYTRYNNGIIWHINVYINNNVIQHTYSKNTNRDIHNEMSYGLWTCLTSNFWEILGASNFYHLRKISNCFLFDIPSF